MRNINKIIVHHSDTPSSMNIGLKEIDIWHRKRGFNGVGYHYVIRRNGQIQEGRALNKVGAHTYGYNRKSIGICLVGRDEYNPSQFASLKKLIKKLSESYLFTVHGHYEFSKKTCPNFDVQEFMKEDEVDKKIVQEKPKPKKDADKQSVKRTSEDNRSRGQVRKDTSGKRRIS